MEKYKILDHPADIKVQAFGKTKQELFLNVMRGMAAVLRPEIRSTKSETQNIKVDSIDLDNLLVDFLSEVLYLTQVNKRVYNNIKFFKFSDRGLEGELSGHEVESFGEDIKGVTYHGLKIEKNKNGFYEAIILFDI